MKQVPSLTSNIRRVLVHPNRRGGSKRNNEGDDIVVVEVEGGQQGAEAQLGAQVSRQRKPDAHRESGEHLSVDDAAEADEQDRFRGPPEPGQPIDPVPRPARSELRQVTAIRQPLQSVTQQCVEISDSTASKSKNHRLGAPGRQQVSQQEEGRPPKRAPSKTSLPKRQSKYGPPPVKPKPLPVPPRMAPVPIQEQHGESDSASSEATIPMKSYHRGFSPPDTYLPMPPVVPSGRAFSPSKTPEEGLLTSGIGSRHLWPTEVITRFGKTESKSDFIRQCCYAMYHRLPKTPNGLPVLGRLRRRLIRLCGHAVLAHSRGRHEVVFQTTYLFDLVMARFNTYVESIRHGLYGHGNSEVVTTTTGVTSHDSEPENVKPPVARPYSRKPTFMEFLVDVGRDNVCFDVASAVKMGRALDKSGLENILSELTEVRRIAESGPAVDCKHWGATYCEHITKEELRAVIVTCMVLASKWNNSRFISPHILCSPPIGRVPITSVLSMEVALLDAFSFNIPFSTSMLGYVAVNYGMHEESVFDEGVNDRCTDIPYVQPLAFYICLMLLEMALSDYRSLYYPMRLLVVSTMFLAETLILRAFGADVLNTGALPYRASADRNEIKRCIDFLAETAECDMRSALLTLPRLKAKGRWTSCNEAPNVFGISINSRQTLGSAGSNFESDSKTKTESVALAFLRVPYDEAFDVLLAAFIGDHFKPPQRMNLLPDISEGRVERLQRLKPFVDCLRVQTRFADIAKYAPRVVSQLVV